MDTRQLQAFCAVVERESFSQAAAEAGMSRIYGGIHWQFDNTDALASCNSLATYVFDHKFAQTSNPILPPPSANAVTPPANAATKPEFNWLQLISHDPELFADPFLLEKTLATSVFKMTASLQGVFVQQSAIG